MTNVFSQNDYKEVNMKYEVGDIVPVPMYIGNAHNKPIHLPARILEIYPKGHLGVMYLCETLHSKFKTCIVVPPPPRFQPDPREDKDIQRWTKPTRYNALEVEPEPAPRKPKESRYKETEDMYKPLLEHLGLDLEKKRSKGQLRSLAHYRGFDYGKIERGIYEWL
jgi:hypothetical protein